MTCVTPPDRLRWYTNVLVDAWWPFDRALLVIDQVVFREGPELEALRRAAGELRPVREAPGHGFEGEADGLRAALEAALSNGMDLRVLLHPTRNALRADHDDYTTFFSESAGKLAEVRQALAAGGVRLVEYTAPAP